MSCSCIYRQFAHARHSYFKYFDRITNFHLQDLPSDATQIEVENLFKNFVGFERVNLIQNKPGIGFVEFNDIYQAAAALALNTYNLRGNIISVTYA